MFNILSVHETNGSRLEFCIPRWNLIWALEFLIKVSFQPGYLLLPENERFDFTPHRVTDKHGVHFAQELSGNVSIKEIFRYAKPSQEEMQNTIKKLFEN